MKESQNNLLKVIGYELNNASRETVCDISDWEGVLAEAGKHGLINFAIDSAGRLELSEKNKDVIAKCKNISLQKIVTGTHVEKMQNELLQLLQKNDIPYCVLKGTSISSLYEKPRLRPSGDVDVYIPPEHIKHASEIMLADGYKYYQTTTTYHMSYVKNGVEIEVHNTLPGMPKGKSGENLSFLKNLDKRADKIASGNLLLAYPNTCDNGIIQMCHILHHILDEGMSLRLLCDWMMLVKNRMPDENWNTEICQVYQKAGLDKMAKLLTKTCILYLGMAGTNFSWCMETSDDACKRFIEFIFEQVDREVIRASKKTSSENNYEGELKVNTWEYNGSHYLINAIKRNIVMVLTGKRGIKTIINIMKKRNADAKLLLNLCLFTRNRVRDYAK